jgi:spermidine/putrescine transport system substrate-binding protein
MPTQEYGRTRRNRPSCEHDEVLMYSIPALLLTVIVSLLLCHTTVAAGDPPELVVLNWPNYLDPELVDRFEQQHGVKVREVFFEGDDQRDEMLVNSDGAGYDVVLVSGNMLRTYMRSGWLQPMTEQQVPNLVHVAPRWRTAFAAADGFAAPYTWGTLGIGYREDLVPEPIDSWMQVFRPAPPLQGRMAMLSHNRDLVGMALMALGHSSNSHDEHELMQAEELLLAQRPHVRTYGYIGLNGDSAMVSGEIAAAMMFNGDALMLQEFEPRIRFIVPREGGNLWVDYFVVMSRSTRKDVAFGFVDFLNEPENAAQAAQFVHYATTNDRAKQLLPEDFLANPVIHPSPETLERSEFFEPLPPRITQRFNSITANVIR